MNKILSVVVLTLALVLIGSAVVFGSTTRKGNQSCNDGTVVDYEVDGYKRITYIGAEDTCHE